MAMIKRLLYVVVNIVLIPIYLIGLLLWMLVFVTYLPIMFILKGEGIDASARRIDWISFTLPMLVEKIFGYGGRQG